MTRKDGASASGGSDKVMTSDHVVAAVQGGGCEATPGWDVWLGWEVHTVGVVEGRGSSAHYSVLLDDRVAGSDAVLRRPATPADRPIVLAHGLRNGREGER